MSWVRMSAFTTIVINHTSNKQPKKLNFLTIQNLTYLKHEKFIKIMFTLESISALLIVNYLGYLRRKHIAIE